MVRVTLGTCQPIINGVVTLLASIYRVLLQSPSAMVHDLRSTAIFLEPVVDNVAIKHPLVCLVGQVVETLTDEASLSLRHTSTRFVQLYQPPGPQAQHQKIHRPCKLTTARHHEHPKFQTHLSLSPFSAGCLHHRHRRTNADGRRRCQPLTQEHPDHLHQCRQHHLSRVRVLYPVHS